MLIGISGAHGCGKTTLAEEFALRSGLEYLPASVNEMAKSAGYAHGSVSLDLTERINLQWTMLGAFRKLLAKSPADCVTDRTPLDVAAYTLAEIGMHSDKAASADSLNSVPELVKEAQRLTKAHFQHVMLLRPLPSYEVIEGKRPPANKAFQMHYQYLLEGIAFDTHMGRSFSVSMTISNSLSERLSILADEVADVMDRKSNIVEEFRSENLH